MINRDASGDIAEILMALQEQSKAYHWQTKSFAEHEAFGKLYEDIQGPIDAFIEALTGHRGNQIDLGEANLEIKAYTGVDAAKADLMEARSFLQEMRLDDGGTDLGNIRDEITGAISLCLYRLTLNNRGAYNGQPVMLSNRKDFALPTDGFYHIVPLGEFVHKPTNLVQVIDGDACEAIVNRFNDEASGSNFPGLLVDYDHFSQDTDKPSEAAGWITVLENREDGIWAQIRWSDKGQEAVAGGRYRLVSPVWKRGDCDTLDNGRVRPLRLDSVALTNDPNLKGLVPLSNRVSLGGDAEMDTRLELTSLLGLGADATDDEIKQALDERQHAPRKKAAKRVKNRSEVMSESHEDQLTREQVDDILANREAEFETERSGLQNRLDELQTELQAMREAQVENDLQAFAPVITDVDAAREMLVSNRAGAIKFLQGIKPAKGSAPKPLHNREDAELPDGNFGAPVGESDAKRITNRAREIMSTTKMANGRPVPFHSAFAMAQGELARE